MVVSYSKNFIFLRIPKNASSTLAKYFVDQCDKSTDKWTILHYSGIRENGIPKDVIYKYALQYQHVHLTLQQIVDEKIITVQDAENMKKIAVIRNPLERQLSLYFFLIKNEKSNSCPNHFREWFRFGRHITDVNNKNTQAEFVKLNGIIPPNVEFWKYDNLQDYIPQKLEYINSGFRPKDMKYLIAEYYDDKTKKAVEDYYAEDIEIYSKL